MTLRTLSRFFAVAGASAALLFTVGCQTYSAQSAATTSAVKTGDLFSAISSSDKQAGKAQGSKDEIVYRLEQGAILRTAALADPALVPDFRTPPKAEKDQPAPAPLPALTAAEAQAHYLKRSLEAFDVAEERVNKYEEEAKIKVGSEAAALFTNQAVLPYRGRAYDKVMLNTYKAISYLALGERDKARVEINRALQRQRDAVEANEKRIAAAQEAAEKAARGELKDESGKSASYDSNKALNDPKTGPGLQAALDASIVPMKAYGDYVNPFSVFLDGLYFSVLGENGSDWERGRKSFERVASMVPENAFVQTDLAAAGQAAEGKAIEGVTYVIFETGTTASRDQVRIDIPTFIVTSRLAYIGASFPKLVYNADYVPYAGVTADGQTFRTSTVASMDSVVANDFKNEWPTIVTKTLITTATKAILQAAVEKAAEDRGGMWGGLAAKLIMTGVNAATNIADTRNWNTLPKEFQYARVATPADRTLTLDIGGAQKTVQVEPGSVNIVYVKSTSTAAPVHVSQFVLKP